MNSLKFETKRTDADQFVPVVSELRQIRHLLSFALRTFSKSSIFVIDSLFKRPRNKVT